MMNMHGIPTPSGTKPLDANSAARGGGFRPVQARASRSHDQADTNRRITQFDEEINVMSARL